MEFKFWQTALSHYTFGSMKYRQAQDSYFHQRRKLTVWQGNRIWRYVSWALQLQTVVLFTLGFFLPLHMVWSVTGTVLELACCGIYPAANNVWKSEKKVSLIIWKPEPIVYLIWKIDQIIVVFIACWNGWLFWKKNVFKGGLPRNCSLRKW